MAKRIDFELTKPQTRALQLLRKPTTDVNLEWGRGCGKSWFDRFLAWFWVASADGKSRLDLLEELGVAHKLNAKQRRKAAKVKGIRVVFLMPTLKQFKDVHGGAVKQEVEEWAHLKPNPNWTDWKISFPGGSWVQPFPAADHSSQRARGIRCDIVIGDECDDIDPSVFDSVVRPWFSEPWSLKIRLTSGTYKRGRHGLLYQRRLLGEDPASPRYHSIHATYEDNPEIVDAEEVADAKKTTNPAVFDREWKCDPDSGEGLVYPFDESFHVVPESKVPNLRTFQKIVVGGDHGWNDPGVLLLIGIQGHGNDAVAWVVDEHYESECPNKTWNERAKGWNYASPHWLDPSRPDRIDEFRASGVNAQPADNNIAGGLSRVADMLFARETEEGVRWCRLYVSAKCTKTIWEFANYRWKKDPKVAEKLKDEPEDANNHAMDSLRYALVGEFGRGTSQRHEAPGR